MLQQTMFEEVMIKQTGLDAALRELATLLDTIIGELQLERRNKVTEDEMVVSQS